MSVISWVAAGFAIIAAGLGAGLFAGFSIAVMPAFDRGEAGEAEVAMRRINRIILRPVFLVPFLSAPVFAAGAAIAGPTGGALPFWIAAVLLAGGSVLPTMLVNVPLNQRLDRGAVNWTGYSPRWTWWNHLRALAGFASLVAIGIGLYGWGALAG